MTRTLEPPALRCLTFDDAVSYLQDNLNLSVTKTYLYRQSSLGHVTFFGVGKKKVCTEADLLAFVDGLRLKAQHQADQRGRGPVLTPKRSARLPDVDADIKQLVTGGSAAERSPK